MIPDGITVLADGTIIGRRGAPLKGGVNPVSGYRGITCKINGRDKTFSVHVLVCETFHGEKPFPEAQVRHLDGNPLNNAASNLKWGTAAENAADTRRHGRTAHQRGEQSGRARLTWDQVRQIRKRYAAGGVSHRDLAAEYRVHRSAIGPLLSGRTWVDPDYTPPVYKGPTRGEHQHDAKLSEEQVREIRVRYAAGGISQKVLAVEYNLSQPTVGRIVRRENWKHVN